MLKKLRDKFRNHFLFHKSTSNVILFPGETYRILSVKGGRTLAKGNWNLTIAISLAIGGLKNRRRVRSWSWMWDKNPRPMLKNKQGDIIGTRTQAAVQAWMDNKPGPFRMNNGQTFKEWKAEQTRKRLNG